MKYVVPTKQNMNKLVRNRNPKSSIFSSNKNKQIFKNNKQDKIARPLPVKINNKILKKINKKSIPKITTNLTEINKLVLNKSAQTEGKVYNPVSVMTVYNTPVLHHIPINQIIKKYVPVYYPVPVEKKIIIPVKVPIKVTQRVYIFYF